MLYKLQVLCATESPARCVPKAECPKSQQVQVYEKPGMCPVLPEDSAGIALEDCRNDGECQSDMKCCFNGGNVPYCKST